jgi:hypothetical protein
MDIENEVYIWVEFAEKNESGFLIQGIAFDGDFGFGKEGCRSFSGEVSIISNSTHETTYVELSVAHLKGKGSAWQIISESVPSPPFIISTNVALHGPSSLKVKVALTDSANEIFEKDRFAAYPVVGNNIIGILEYMAGDSRLLFFSERSDMQLSYPTEIFFSEWSMPVGLIRPINNE